MPEGLTTRAEVPGIAGARYWVGVDIEPFVRDVLEAREREAKHRASSGLEGELPVAALLGVSGGGDNGAFGAGLLCGWSESGTRPQFKAVTGVSTGALIAPFAFAGPEYDHVLRSVFTSLGPSDVARKRSLLAAINNDGMADNRPLGKQISRYADESLLKKIADEHAKGRILLVGTTNLDACQPVIWNVGKIAASGAPGALDLFRTILLAPAAIPGAFPPTMFRIYGTAQRDGLDFNLAFIDDDFHAEHRVEFDTHYMRALFDHGFRQGRDGYPWKKTPPRLNTGLIPPS